MLPLYRAVSHIILINWAAVAGFSALFHRPFHLLDNGFSRTFTYS